MPRSPLVDPCVMPACLAGQACVITHPRVTRRWSAGGPPMPVDHGRTAANRPDRAIGTPRQNPPARVMSPAGTAGTLGFASQRRGTCRRLSGVVRPPLARDCGRAVAQSSPTGRGAPPGARFGVTKFRPLTLPPTLVSRPALHLRLAAGTEQRLTVVVGSAGAGTWAYVLAVVRPGRCRPGPVLDRVH